MKTSSIYGYEYLTDLIWQNINDVFESLKFLNDLDMCLLAFGGGFAGTIVFRFFYTQTFSKILKINKTMESIIPTDLIMNNETMMMFIFGAKREEEKKRRIEKRRRARNGGR